MMKKILLLVFVTVAAAVTLPAKTELLNLTYSHYNSWLGIDDARLTSVGLSVVGVYDNNFYFQFNGTYGISYEINGNQVILTDYDYLQVGGLSTILGFGHDFNFGLIGLVLGGGVFGDFNLTQLKTPSYNYYYNSSNTQNYFYLTGGLGVGANFYIKFGNFVINAGVMAAWNPLTYSFSNSYSGSEEATNLSQMQLSAGLGIGWSK